MTILNTIVWLGISLSICAIYYSNCMHLNLTRDINRLFENYNDYNEKNYIYNITINNTKFICYGAYSCIKYYNVINYLISVEKNSIDGKTASISLDPHFYSLISSWLLIIGITLIINHKNYYEKKIVYLKQILFLMMGIFIVMFTINFMYFNSIKSKIDNLSYNMFCDGGNILSHNDTVSCVDNFDCFNKITELYLLNSNDYKYSVIANSKKCNEINFTGTIFFTLIWNLSINILTWTNIYQFLHYLM